ncbi:uracil-DNA glycosylase [Methylorubrum thiocyanatum]
MTPDDFIDALAGLRFNNVFNPYADACVDHDAPGAAAIRRTNLRLVLEAAIAGGVDSIWIARDLGYRGGRRTGLALTDEVHLAAHAGLYGRLPLARATRGPAMAERTATVIWDVLTRIERPIFLWNVFPLHPHEPNDPLSNRCHTRAERQASWHLLQWILSVLQPRTLVAIGRDAEAALADFGVHAEKARHPSYGGQTDFVSKMRSIYSLRPSVASGVQLSFS